MKKVLWIISLFLFITNVNAQNLYLKKDNINIKSKNVIMYNLNENKKIFTEKENEKVQIASLTKIMTALITIENIDNLDKIVVIKQNDIDNIVKENLVAIGLKVGDRVTYNDLLHGLLFYSGADCANALAHNTFNDETKFIEKMNEKAKQLNLKNTHFSNTIGLDDEENYSTASDLAHLFKYALKNKTFKKIITENTYTTSNNIFLKNKIRHNNNVGNYLLGGKTGTTNNAGLCLASIAKKNKINYLLVTLNAPFDRKGPHNYEDAKTIYEYFFNNYSYQTIKKKNEVLLSLKTKYAKEDKVKFFPKKNIKVYLPNNIDKKDIKYIYKGKKTIKYNTKENTKLGYLKIYYQDKPINTQKIVLKEKLHFSIIKYLKDHKLLLFIPIFLLIILIVRGKNGKNKSNVKMLRKSNAKQSRRNKQNNT